jgi:peptidoglycan/LPS O-acetylase OafA/YrhL
LNFNTKNYNYNFIRFIAALMVIISHSFALSLGASSQHYIDSHHLNLININTWGFLAVAVFFFGSGFYIAKSCERNESFLVFLLKRLFKLLPMLILVVLISIFIIGPVFTTLPLKDYFSNILTWKYLLNGILILQHNLPGVFTNNVYMPTVNGALWTLPVEFLCYLFCYIFYKIFKNKDNIVNRIMLVLSVIVILGAFLLQSHISSLYDALCPAISFWLGIQYWINREHLLNIKKPQVLFIASIILFVLVFPVKSLSALAVWICVPYFMFYVMFISKHQHFQKAEILGDCSYCMYLIGFPIQQSIVYVMGGGPINPFINIITTVVIDIALALLMHIFIERRVENLTRNILKKWFRH